MSDQKFDPLKEIVHFRDNISRAVRSAVRGDLPFPALDVYETDDSIVVRTEPLIGLKPNSVRVSMAEDMLTLSGETIQDLNVPPEQYIQRELVFGEFTREVRIPREVQAEKARARIRGGSLVVTLPKREIASDSQIISVTPIDA